MVLKNAPAIVELRGCPMCNQARDACFCEKSSTIISLTEPTIEKKGKRKEEREREKKKLLLFYSLGYLRE